MRDRPQRLDLEPMRLQPRYAAPAGVGVVEIEAIDLAVRPLGDGTARRFAVARRIAESAVLVAVGMAVGLGAGGSESKPVPAAPTAEGGGAPPAPVTAPVAAAADRGPIPLLVSPVGPDGRLTAAGEQYLVAFGYLPTGTPWYLPSPAAARRSGMDAAACAEPASEDGEDGTSRGCPRP